MLENQGIFVFILIVFSLIIGSFLSMLVYRIPIMLFRSWHKECKAYLAEHQAHVDNKQKMNIAFPRSHCPTCEHPLNWYCNIPILGYLIQKGKCKFCNK